MAIIKLMMIFRNMRLRMTKATSILLILMIAVLLTGCSEPAYSGDASVVPYPSVSASGTPAATPAATPSTTPVPTTVPDDLPASTPTEEPTVSATTSTIPAGIVKDSGQIIGTDVAFRKGPDKDSELIGRLNHGTFVKVLKTNVDAQWHQVEYDGKTGYVNRMYICLDSSMDGYALDYVGTIVNCSNDVNVRSGPSKDSEVIGVVKKETTLNILPYENYVEGWYMVEYEGQVAYISADYVDIDAVVEDNQLSDLTVTGGALYPSFTPNEYGYVVKAAGSSVTIKAKANSGVEIDIGKSGKSSYTIEIPSAGMKTVRIALNGEIRYSLYITSQDLLTVGTWNIKRGDGKLLNQGRLIYDQQPDIMGIQEAYQKLKADNIIDNLASLKTRNMPYNVLSPTINYSNGGQYGNGLISRYKLTNVETFKLDSGGSEKRILQKAVVEIDGKTVSLYNTHFTPGSASTRKKQFAQVLEIMDADNNNYKILTGDFNAKFSEFSVFKNYTVVNTDDTKYYDYAKNEIDYSALDNIVVSKNIEVVNSRIIITSFSDHYAVFAYLILD
jgi:endonuclease/exonuclease/phosphatase family metal-dependent hydrolase/SH3-like domain-containing protein